MGVGPGAAGGVCSRQEQSLAREIAAATDATAGQLEPRTIAAAVLNVMRVLQERALAELSAGHPHPSPAALHDDLDRVFNLLATGLGHYGRS